MKTKTIYNPLIIYKWYYHNLSPFLLDYWICYSIWYETGFSAHNRIGILKADSDVDLTYEGDNTVLLQAVSKALLKEYQSWFTGEKRITGMINYLGRNIGILLRYSNALLLICWIAISINLFDTFSTFPHSSLSYNNRNKNPVTKHMLLGEKNQLRNFSLLVDAFVYREFKLMRVLVNKLQYKTQTEKRDPFDAWNEW